MRLRIAVVVFSVIFLSCASDTTPKKTVGSIPIEAVDTETQGERAGDTHFRLGLHDLSYSYENFESAEESSGKLRERSEFANLIVDKGEITDAAGAVVGSYQLIRISSTPMDQEYCLLWSNAKRFAKVCSKSIEGIEQFRSQYEL